MRINGTNTRGDVLHGGEESDDIYGYDLNDSLYGHGGDDHLYGGRGYDALWGGPGADTLDGGEDDDWAMYVDSSEGVYVSLVTGRGHYGTAEGDTLISIENLRGSTYDDQLIGNDGANTLLGDRGADWLYGNGGVDALYGGNDNDTLYGGDGADRLDGGEGTDTASYLDARERVDVSLLEGRGHGGTAEGDTLFNIENLLGSRYGDTLDGDDSANSIKGDAGDDTIYGGGGVDVLSGGDNNDRLIGGRDGDILDGGHGSDTASYEDSASGVSVSLVTGRGYGGTAEGDTLISIENLAGSAYDDLLVGADEQQSNMLSGNSGNDTLKGGGGFDHLLGGAGNDWLDGGNDIGELDTLVLSADWGAYDWLVGGTGADTFAWSSINDTGPYPGFMDYIADFNRAEGDRINLHGIDANSTAGAGGNQDFLRVVAGYGTRPGDIGYTTDGIDTFIHLNTDTDAAAEASIRVHGVYTVVDASWFVF